MIELARGVELGDRSRAAVGLDLNAIQPVALEDVGIDIAIG
jgi:hypothetical protein